MTQTNDIIDRASALIKQMQLNKAKELEAEYNMRDYYERLIAAKSKPYDDLIAAKSKPYDDVITEQMKIIEAEMLMLQESYKSKDINATYRRGYERISWNTDMLNGYFADKHVDVVPFRKITYVDPGVTIKIL